MFSLKNDVVRLRAVEPSDAELLYVWENDTDVWQAGETLTPFSRATLQYYTDHVAQQDIYEAKQLRLMIDTDEEIPTTIGSIDLFDFNPYHKRAGVGILIYNSNDRQKGYASSALQVLVNYAFRVLGLHQLYCNIAVNNEKSLNLFRKVGFEVTGTKKAWLFTNTGWVDELILQLINR